MVPPIDWLNGWLFGWLVWNSSRFGVEGVGLSVRQARLAQRQLRALMSKVEGLGSRLTGKIRGVTNRACRTRAWPSSRRTS